MTELVVASPSRPTCMMSEMQVANSILSHGGAAAASHDNVTLHCFAADVCAQTGISVQGKVALRSNWGGRSVGRVAKRGIMKLLLIQGANMEYLGRRQPELYGTTTAKELDSILRRQARRLGVSLDILYTNTEGEAVSAIFKADRARVDGILFNPAGFLHAGYALRDCLRSIRAPAIEIHMTNIEKRGYGSITAEAAVGMIAGFGVDSYILALQAMVVRLS